MTNGNERAQQMRAEKLDGRTTHDYFRFVFEDFQKINSHSQEPANTLSLAAYTVHYCVDMLGYFFDDDFNDSTLLQSLGLSPEESSNFFTDTMPEFRELLAKEQQATEIRNQQKELEQIEKFNNRWGLDRLQQIASHFQSKIEELNKINPNWSDAINLFQNQKEKIATDFANVNDSKTKFKLLSRQLYFLTFLHPSEAWKINAEELETGSYIYVDSLRRIAPILYKNSNGKDPDFSSYHGDGFSLSYYSIDDPESINRQRRQEAIEELVFGAQKPNETINYFKPQKRVTPLKKIVYAAEKPKS